MSDSMDHGYWIDVLGYWIVNTFCLPYKGHTFLFHLTCVKEPLDDFKQ